jgi:transglutaminase-like putative cysteine protease
MSPAMPPARPVAGNAPAPSTWRERLKRLPRESRDTLFLLAVIAWTLLPHVQQLPLWASAVGFGLLGWRARAAWRSLPLPPRWVPVVLLLVAVALVLVQYRTVFGKEAGVTLVALLVAMKTLELRARRDAFVVFFLGFFLVLTQFLYSQALLTALAMLVSVWGLLTALVLAHMPVGQPALGRAAGLALRTALLGAPLMALLFVLFPRVAPLWGLPQDAGGRSGLSSTMKLGHVAELAVDEKVALRVRFPDGRVPPSEQLYFRGPVLVDYDGIEWRRRDSPFLGASAGQLRFGGEPIRYDVMMEPSRLSLLPLLEMTPGEPGFDGDDGGLHPRRRDDLQWSTRIPVMERVRFSAVAYAQFSHGPTSRTGALQAALALPAGRHPRLQEWARSLREQLFPDGTAAAQDAPALAMGVLQHIRTQPFVYTLAPGDYLADTLDEFWFERREGFCEHYAAAFVVALRAMGVPARVVTGYQGGEFNAVDGNLEVRNADAHAWAEYWRPGVGWQRADPTAAVAPDRVLGPRRLTAPRGVVGNAINNMNPALMAQMRALWNAADNAWNQWVLNYTRGQQLDVLKQLGLEARTWEDVTYILIAVLCSLALAGAAWAWWDQRRVDPWLRAYRRTLDVLAERGVPAGPHTPPRTLAHQALARHGDAARPLADALVALERARYAPAGMGMGEAAARARAALRAARTLPAIA